jgi:hypothetical protein
MAQQVQIGKTFSFAKVRNPWGVLGLTVITLGVYSLVWWFQINREMRDLGRARGTDGLGTNPALSTLAFSGLTAFLLYVPLVWTVITTCGRVRRAQSLSGQTGFDRSVAALLWIFTLTLGGMVYTQHQLNKVWRAEAAAGEAGPPPEGQVPPGFEPPRADPPLAPLRRVR